MPTKQTVDIRPGSYALDIKIPWSRLTGLTFLPGIVILILIAGVTTDWSDWTQVAFSGIEIALALFLLYLGIGMFINRTHIRVAQGKLTVRHSPMPYLLKDQLIRTDKVKQFYVRVSKTFKNHHPVITYTIHALLIDGNSKRLQVPDHLSATECRQIEQALEDHLGITNEPVSGEYLVS